MFHFIEKPRPPLLTGRLTCGQSVDSSAMITVPGERACVMELSSRRKLDGLQVLAAAMHIGNEVGAAREVQIQHRGHGIHAQAVEMEFLQPEAGAGEQEAAHFVPLVVEDVRAPVLVLALARIGVFIQRRAVEARQRMRVAREVRRHPVQQHADARLVALVDEELEVRRGAEAAGGREIARGLVAPGIIQRMLGDGQQLYVREAQPLHIGNQLFGQFAV